MNDKKGQQQTEEQSHGVEPVKPLPVEVVATMNEILMKNLVNNSTHMYLGEDDKKNHYFLFSVNNEDSLAKNKEGKLIPVAGTNENHTWLSLAKKIKENLSAQADEAKRANLSPVDLGIPFLGLKEIDVKYAGSDAILNNARLISTNNGWTLSGQIAFRTNSSRAKIGLVILKRSEKNKQSPDEAQESKVNEDRAKEVSGL